MLDMTFASRLKKARNAKKLSKAEVGRQIGVARQAVTMWESGKAEPKAENARKLSISLDVSHEWLITGRGSQAVAMYATGLTLRGVVAAGVWLEAVESQEMEYERVPVAPDPRYPVDAQYALRIRGQSVNKTAKDGSIIVCVDIMAAGIEIRDGDLVVVERRRGELTELTVKRLRRGNGGLELWPESDDPAHQEKLSLGPRKGNTEVSVKALVIWTANPVVRG